MASPEVGLRSWREPTTGFVQFQIAVVKEPNVAADVIAQQTFDQIWYDLDEAGVSFTVDSLFFRDARAISGVECKGHVSLNDFERAEAVFRRRSQQPWIPQPAQPLPPGQSGKALE